MFQATNATRLTDELLTRGFPVVRVSGTTAGTVAVQYAQGTSQVVINNANAYVQNTFDWSDAAHTAWLTAQRRIRARDQYDATDETGKLFRGLMLVLLDEINALRAAVVPPLPARTANQIRTALANKLNSLD